MSVSRSPQRTRAFAVAALAAWVWMCSGAAPAAAVRARGTTSAALIGETVAAQDPSEPVGTWRRTGDMIYGRYYHSATLLLDGRALVVGGGWVDGTAEIYDPQTAVWRFAGYTRWTHNGGTATLLRTGEVLVVGGAWGEPAELFEPLTVTWRPADGPAVARARHTATRLRNDQVLVAGGEGAVASAELYDPDGRLWQSTGSMITGRSRHTAVLLHDGRVMVAGGFRTDAEGVSLSSVEFYDPATGEWQSGPPMGRPRSMHTATVLNDGRVLVAGGAYGKDVPDASAEVFDPAENRWYPTSDLAIPRCNFTATLLPSGEVLVAGGGDTNSPYDATRSAEVFDPASGAWAATEPMNARHSTHTATLLPDGTVLVAGDYLSGEPINRAELFDRYRPTTRGTWRKTGSMHAARSVHAAALLHCGLALVAGGYGEYEWSSGAELYDPETEAWLPTAAMPVRCRHPQAVVLSDGRVLVVGDGGDGAVFELYDPGSGTWHQVAGYGGPRTEFSLTPLGDGRVLLTESNEVALFDPATDTWRHGASMIASRSGHTATRLRDGRVLVAGGYPATQADAEVYDSSSDTWTATGPMRAPTRARSASLLLDGRVLLAGGDMGDGETPTEIAEIYDPETNAWSATGALVYARMWHPATLLPSGQVLVVGGYSPYGGSWGELFDPTTGAWSLTGRLNADRFGSSSTLLPGGSVLVAGGYWGGEETAELYVPPSTYSTAALASWTRRYFPIASNTNPHRQECWPYRAAASNPTGRE